MFRILNFYAMERDLSEFIPNELLVLELDKKIQINLLLVFKNGLWEFVIQPGCMRLLELLVLGHCLLDDFVLCMRYENISLPPIDLTRASTHSVCGIDMLVSVSEPMLHFHLY